MKDILQICSNSWENIHKSLSPVECNQEIINLVKECIKEKNIKKHLYTAIELTHSFSYDEMEDQKTFCITLIFLIINNKTIPKEMQMKKNTYIKNTLFYLMKNIKNNVENCQDIIKNIENAPIKAEAYIYLAEIYVYLEDYNTATVHLNKASEVTTQMKEDEKSQLLKQIIQIFLELNIINPAIKCTNQFSIEKDKIRYLKKICKHLISKNNLDNARLVALTLKEENKTKYLQIISKKSCDLSYIAKAKEIADEIPDTYEKIKMYLYIAKKYVENKDQKNGTIIINSAVLAAKNLSFIKGYLSACKMIKKAKESIHFAFYYSDRSKQVTAKENTSCIINKPGNLKNTIDCFLKKALKNLNNPSDKIELLLYITSQKINIEENLKKSLEFAYNISNTYTQIENYKKIFDISLKNSYLNICYTIIKKLTKTNKSTCAKKICKYCLKQDFSKQIEQIFLENIKYLETVDQDRYFKKAAKKLEKTDLLKANYMVCEIKNLFKKFKMHLYIARRYAQKQDCYAGMTVITTAENLIRHLGYFEKKKALNLLKNLKNSIYFINEYDPFTSDFSN